MYRQPFDRTRHCRYPNCVLTTSNLSGFCKNHEERIRSDTSDGRPGNRSKPKLTADDVVEIMRMHAAFKTSYEIARHFKVRHSTIRDRIRQEKARRASVAQRIERQVPDLNAGGSNPSGGTTRKDDDAEQ